MSTGVAPILQIRRLRHGGVCKLAQVQAAPASRAAHHGRGHRSCGGDCAYTGFRTQELKWYLAECWPQQEVLEGAGSRGPRTLHPTPNYSAICTGASGLITRGRCKSRRSEVAQAPMPGQRADLYVTNLKAPRSRGGTSDPWPSSEMLFGG